LAGVGRHGADYSVVPVIGNQDQRSGQVGLHRIVGVADELLGDVPVETFLAPAQPRPQRPPGGPRGNRVGQHVVKGHARQRRQFADRAHVSGYRLAHANPGCSRPPGVEFSFGDLRRARPPSLA
jgi:hypothetical protein